MLPEQSQFPAEAGYPVVQSHKGEALMRRSSSADQFLPLKPLRRSLSSVNLGHRKQPTRSECINAVPLPCVPQSADDNSHFEQRSEASTSEGESILVNESAVQEAIGRLRRYRQVCSDQGLYKEAKVAHEQIQELQAYLSMVVKQSTKGRHLLERAAVERAHRKEIERFTTCWVRL